MDVYIYQASLYCDDCGEKIRRDLSESGKAPADPDDECSYDSYDYPQGPISDGGGESDSLQFCDDCGTSLENPLTEDGVAAVAESIVDSVGRDAKSLHLDYLRAAWAALENADVDWRELIEARTLGAAEAGATVAPKGWAQDGAR
jgi:hypothetical protein